MYARTILPVVMVLFVMSLWSVDTVAVDLEILVMPGPVITGHAKLESECSNCHVAFSRDRQSALCLDCHEDIKDDLESRQGYHGQFDKARAETCASCHTDHEGRSAMIISLDTGRFDHRFTDFDLSGAHAEADCRDCHVEDAKYREAPLACFDCHKDDDVHKGGLGYECHDCHGNEAWSPARFDHEGETGYALEGEHTRVECASCHIDEVYLDTPTDCIGCHSSDDTHEGLNGSDCAFCHVSRAWVETVFDHATKTDFGLSGQHSRIACTDCHANNVFDVALGNACIDCHRDDDSHEGHYGDDCKACHSADRWPDISFAHDLDTKFPLFGRHRDAGCVDCHVEPVHLANPAADCFSCHRSDDRHEGQLGESCGRCHNESDWTTQVIFDHGLTAFPLIGLHLDTGCVDCHETPRFRDAPLRCIDCHQQDDVHEKTLGPVCEDCHNPVDWSFWNFDHNLRTRFEIDGAHSDLACGSCHKRPVKSVFRLPGTCSGCHRADDVHRGEFGDDCLRCHTTENFHSVERVFR